MVDPEQVFAICERVAEIQALLDDHVAGHKHTPEYVVSRVHQVLNEEGLLRAMAAVGYFPPDTPPPVTLADN